LCTSTESFYLLFLGTTREKPTALRIRDPRYTQSLGFYPGVPIPKAKVVYVFVLYLTVGPSEFDETFFGASSVFLLQPRLLPRR
jgi:hypothetical protein